MKGNEEKAKQFLEWISIDKNTREMKKALAKNTTYNQEIFDDVFQDAIVKVYNSLLNGSVINDFKAYMFVTLKFNYIQRDNQLRNRQRQEVRFEDNTDLDFIDDSDLEEEELKDRGITEALEAIRNILLGEFSEKDTDLFIGYYKLKTIKCNLGYKELSAMTGTNVKYIANLIPRMRKWFFESEEINNIKDKLKKNGLY